MNRGGVRGHACLLLGWGVEARLRVQVVFCSFGSSRGSSWISRSARGRPSSISRLRSRSAFSWWPKRIARLRDPEPDEQRDQPAERAVGLVVGAEVGDVEGEEGRGDDPDDDRDQAAGRHPLEAAQLHVRRGVVEDGDHQQEDERHHRPLGDVPDVDRGRADTDRPGDRVDHRPGERPGRDGEQRQQQDHRQGDEDLQRPQLPERPPLGRLVDDVRGAHEGADVAGGRPERDARGRARRRRRRCRGSR